MAIIGTFKKVANGFEGEFAMLALQVKGVRIALAPVRETDFAVSKVESRTLVEQPLGA